MGAEVGALLAVGGLITQISAQGQAQDAQRSQLESQARGAKESARLARLEGIENAKLQQIQADKILSGIRPQFAAAGVEEEGSVFDVISNSVQNAERDRLNILYSSELRAQGFERGAFAYAQAGAGINNLQQIGTGLGGIGDIVSRFA